MQSIAIRKINTNMMMYISLLMDADDSYLKGEK